MHFKAEGSPMAYEYKLNSLFLSFSVGSAGVGRTGVFCALSLLIERLKAEGVVDVFQTVKQLRSQRPAMVQTKDQYEFIYKAIAQGAEELFDKCRPSELLSTVTNQHLT